MRTGCTRKRSSRDFSISQFAHGASEHGVSDALSRLIRERPGWRRLREKEARDRKNKRNYCSFLLVLSYGYGFIHPVWIGVGYRVHVRTYANRRAPAACACVGGTKRPQRGVAWHRRVRPRGGEGRGRTGARGRNTSGEPLWKEDMMARGVMLRELLCSSGTTGP